MITEAFNEGPQGKAGVPGVAGWVEVPPSDPKKRAAITKPQVQYVPPVLAEEASKAYLCGIAKGYGPWNWRGNKVEMMTYLGAIIRHAHAVLDRLDEGDIDPESGAHHFGCIAANCGIGLDALRQGTLIDNRPPSYLNKGRRPFVVPQAPPQSGIPE